MSTMQQQQTAGASKFFNPIRISYQDPSFTTEAETNAANRLNVWHKFILFNIREEEKNEVLDNMIKISSPILFLPVMFKMESENKASFLSMCKSNVISKLVQQNLFIKLSSGRVIYFDIVLSFLTFADMPINPQKVITDVLVSRFTKDPIPRKAWNLEEFSNDPSLGSVYCPIYIPIIYGNILNWARQACTPSNNRDPRLPIRDLILRSNNMVDLKYSDKSFNFHFTKLDLRNNKLDDLTKLKPFADYKLTDLWLDGNPVCAKFESIKDYVDEVRKIFPTLQMLDGQVIGGSLSCVPLPTYNKHYIDNKEKLPLVKQFLEHYFACYDQDDRMVLNGLYDAGAFFSMTVGPIFDNANKQIIKSFATNRNLLKFVDYAKCTEYLLYGPEKILNALRREPPTLHKLKFLDIDLIFSSNNVFAVSVQGPFVYRKSKAPPLWFKKTLIVVAKGDNEYCVVNDHYHIDNCPPEVQSIDLNELRYRMEKSIPVFKPISFSVTEKYQLLRCLQDLTTMNAEYSDKFLREANWDIRLAIKTFMNTYMQNKIPTEAFRW